MPRYTLRTHPDYTLDPGDGQTYRDGDPIEISEADARRIAGRSKFHRFETCPDQPTIGADRHRSGRPAPADVDQPAPKTASS